MTERMSVAEYKALLAREGQQGRRAPGRRAHKYNAVRATSGDGHVFDSQAECAYYERYLLPLLRAGLIRDLCLHPGFVLQEEFVDNAGAKRAAITYHADFAYRTEAGPRLVVVEVKGRRTADFSLRMRLFLRRYPEVEYILVDAKEWAK